jgi:hypothetical protein
MQKEHFEKLCGTQLQWPTHERNCMLLYVTWNLITLFGDT